MPLANKVAIVTGAARGIGFAIARRYCADGAQVMLADIDASAGAAAALQLGADNVARFVACDVGDRDQVEALMSATVEAFGAVDILVNNAAILAGADFLDLKEADFDRVIRVNLKGAFLCGQAAARRMVERVKSGGPAGTVINLSSVNAVFALANQVPYSISKGGISQLTKVMALSLAPWRIRVNAIGPGSIMTEMLQTVMDSPEMRSRILSRTPLGRVGDPSEIAGVAAFLASDDASYITGQTIYADGGRLPLNYTVPVAD
jgi:NAD(P)-dependent dehydrogenase (short-subunit alcohol dehydrogenase family)